MDGEEIPDFGTAKGQEAVKAWLAEIDAARTREKDYRLDAEKCVQLFEAAKNSDRQPFAILYSNTETLLPALYNARPIPIVKRRYDDADPVGKLAAQIGTRLLKYLIEAEDAEHDSFDSLIAPAVLQALVVNRGVTQYTYDMKSVAGPDGLEVMQSECVFGEEVRWDKFLHGYARTWKKVPWIAFEHDLTRQEAKKLYPKAYSKMEFTKPNDGPGGYGPSKTDEMKGIELARVYVIWCKQTRKVYHVGQSCKEGYLRPPIDDPLNLSSFFPVPKPLNLFPKISTLTPTPLYMQYREQAVELNKLTVRLKNLIDAIRIRGFYNATVENIDKVLKAEDNELIPLDNVNSVSDNGAVDKLIWLMPIQELVQVVQALYIQREQCKQTIYEITGVSDILRGSTVASETATAQNIKNQWGTLRLKRMQKEIQRYCRDSLRIMLEIAINNMDQATIQRMTGLQAPTEQEKAQLVAQRQQLIAAAQQTGQQPPELPDPSSLPTWEAALALLKNELDRSYRIDIETNSTIDAEAAQDKQDIAELLNSLSQFLNGVAPLVQQGVLPFEVAQQMMLAVSRRYNFGTELEEHLLKMQPPQDKPDPAVQAKMEMEKQAHELAMQEKQAELAIKQEESKLKMAELQAKMQFMQAENELKAQEIAMKAQELKQKAEFAAAQHMMKMQQLAAKPAQKEKVDA
jgi:hypothetical protein